MKHHTMGIGEVGLPRPEGLELDGRERAEYVSRAKGQTAARGGLFSLVAMGARPTSPSMGASGTLDYVAARIRGTVGVVTLPRRACARNGGSPAAALRPYIRPPSPRGLGPRTA